MPRGGRRRREGTRWLADIHATPQAYHAGPDTVTTLGTSYRSPYASECVEGKDVVVPSVAKSNKKNNNVLQLGCNINNECLGLPGKGDGVMKRFLRHRLRWRIWLVNQERLLKESIFDPAGGRSS